MTKFIISSKSHDKADVASKLFRELSQKLPNTQFINGVQNIDGVEDSGATTIIDEINQAMAIIIVIGNDWAYGDWLNNNQDIDRIAIQAAIENDNVREVQVFVNNAQLPTDLPQEFAPLHDRLSFQMSSFDVAKTANDIAKAIQQVLAMLSDAHEPALSSAPSPPSPSPPSKPALAKSEAEYSSPKPQEPSVPKEQATAIKQELLRDTHARARSSSSVRQLSIIAFIIVLGVVGALGIFLFAKDDGSDNVTPGYFTDHSGTRYANNDDWTPVTQTFNGIEMMLVPAGCLPDTKCIDNTFWIDRTEITIGMWKECTGQTWCTYRSAATNHNPSDAQPIIGVTWNSAIEYCAWRGGRLPTELEWEYAASGPDGLEYPWGNSFNENNVFYSGNSSNRPSEVGTKPGGASWIGAYDMSGNVWEWTSTVYGNDGGARILRGGSVYRDPTGNDVRLDVSARKWLAPGDQNFVSGFRCTHDYKE